MSTKQKSEEYLQVRLIYLYGLLPSLIGVSVALLLTGSFPFVAAGVGLSGLTLALMWLKADTQFTKASLAKHPWYGSKVATIGMVGILGLICIMGVQTYFVDGRKMAVFIVGSHGLICSLLLLIPSQFSKDHGSGFLWVASAAMGAMCFANLVASFSGLSTVLTEREAFATSYYGDGLGRWQSPLLSAWQLSGLGRWAFPTLCCVILFQRFRIAPVLLGLGWLGILFGTLVLLEYRAALMPLLMFVAWLFVLDWRLRGVVASVGMMYSIAAPFIFGSDRFLSILETVVPDTVIRLSGASLSSILTLSERTEIWHPSMEYLFAGKNVFVGQGIVGLDATDIAAWDLSRYGGLIPKISFHQGFLDLLFMFGALPGILFVITIATWVGRYWVLSMRGEVSRRDWKTGTEGDIALASLMIAAVSNAHDGFLNGHLIFFVIMVNCCVCLKGDIVRVASWAPGRPRESRREPQVKYEVLPAVH